MAGKVMEAVILAGGRGTRLAAVVPDLPKPMAPVAGRPFLEYLLQSLSDSGFRRVVLSIGFRAEAIRSHFGDRFGKLEVAYCHEISPLGTGGGIRAAMHEAKSEQVFVLNGDTFVRIDYSAMFAQHIRQEDDLTVALTPVPDVARYGSVQVEQGRITAFLEKGHSGAGFINAGIYLMRRTLLEDAGLPDVFSFEQDVLMARLQQMKPAVFPASGYFIDIGIPDDYHRAQVELPQQIKL